MTATQAALPALPSLHKIEMEDRKRSLLNDLDDLAPSRKRLKDEHGNTLRMSDEQKERDVEDYQKDAILRQMKEYKRQKKDADDQLSELHKKTKYHNDHLRTLDAWFSQLLDEVRVLAVEALPSPFASASATPPAGDEIYTSALLFEDSATFAAHLKARSSSIRSTISELFSRIPATSADVTELQKQINSLLAREKEQAVDLRKAIDDKDSLYERLEQAMGRYMTAERKLDRAKSTQVMKLERQAMGGSSEGASNASRGATAAKKEQPETNGELTNGMASVEAESARKEAVAAAEKQKAQLEEVEAENSRLTNELSAARTKLASLSDDDYAETYLFKTFKAQFEDAVKRLNDLEATNIQLREEAQKLQAERTAYRTQVDDEHRAQTGEIEATSARAETDLARIRHARDQLSSDLAIFKSAEKNNRTSAELAVELAAAKELRISALESQVQRLELQLGTAETAVAAPDLDTITLESLKTKFQTLTNQYALLEKELPSMEAAWKKAQAVASKKIEEIASWEEQVARLAAEKSKADQKYFAAMKAKDMRESELRSLKSQNARSSEIVSQLKDGEAKAKELCSNYERQLAESRDSLGKLERQAKVLEQKLLDATTSADGFKKTAEEMKALVATKDKDKLVAAKAKRDAEEDLERCTARLEETKKQYDTLRKSRAAVNSADSDDWRKVAICPVCNSNIRNTVLKLCGHVFCSSCVKDLISNRSRKCPSCGRGFGSNDQMGIVLT